MRFKMERVWRENRVKNPRSRAKWKVPDDDFDLLNARYWGKLTRTKRL